MTAVRIFQKLVVGCVRGRLGEGGKRGVRSPGKDEEGVACLSGATENQDHLHRAILQKRGEEDT